MPAAEAPAADQKPSRASRLLALVRQLIDYGRQLATKLSGSPPAGAGDIAVILVRITRGLLRAEALEARIVRSAARLDAERMRPDTPSGRQSPSGRLATLRPANPSVAALACLPTAAQIAVEVRRRPIGAVIADICRDLGILPCHPLWRELRDIITRHGGNLARLVKDIIERPFPPPAPDWPEVYPPSPAPSGAGPP